ncbi:cellulose-binding protein [Allocoleopsis sp.]|uniref:cellulose-binding protein n=1 Tax=Allocoleopsis sp. TaxID=3088169 RepID=UPI002FD70EB8
MTYKKVSKLLVLFGIALFLALAGPPIWSKLAQVKPESNALNPPPSVTSTQAATLPKNLMTNRSLGMGLNGLADYSTQLPFLDAFRTARPWYTSCAYGDPSCEGKGDSNAEVKLDLDEQGWVKSLPQPGSGASYTRVGTLLYRDIPGAFPTGRYVVLYDGEGKLIYEFESKKIEEESKPGRDVINVAGGGAGISIHITETDPNKTGNYIRNIRVVPEQYEKTFATQIFNPVWLEKIKGFQAVRFMDWMGTNNSTQKNWEDRPKLTDYTWQSNGAPIEVMVALANRIKADAWFNMPHMATDDYIKNFAEYVKKHLDPGLKAYVEYSNEVWNWQFQQSHYASEQGKARWGQDLGDAWMQYNGMRAAQVCDIWKKEVFKEASNRVFCVIGTQVAWKGLEESVLNAPKWVAEGNEPPYKHGIDGLAITGYFSGSLGQPENLDTVLNWRSDPDGGFGKAFKQLREGTLLQGGDTIPDTISLFEYHSKVAKEKGLQLVAYEGGSHIVGMGGGQDNEKLTEFLIAINKHPEMYNIYTMLLNGWKKNGGTLFNHFVDVGQPSKWGSWGALHSLNEKGSPRYNALIDFMKNNPTWWPR